MIHDLKVHPQFWPDILSGAKPFEVRKDDRKFKTGDKIILREFDPKYGYTNRGGELKVEVTFVLKHEDFPNGVPVGYVVLGFGKQPHLDDGK